MTQLPLSRSMSLASEDALLERTIAAPDDAGAWHLLALRAAQNGRVQRAFGCLQNAIEIEPDNVTFHLTHGGLLERTGKRARALAAYRRAVEVQPAGVAGLENLCRMLVDGKQLVEAIPFLERFCKVAPANFLPRAWLGQALTACHRLEEADRAFGAALGKEPRMAQLHVERGRVASLRGDLEQARSYWEEAVRLGLPDATSHFAVCHLLYQAGGRERALAEYRAALRRFPDHPRGWTNLALKAPDALSTHEWAQVRRLSTSPDLPAADVAGLHYALLAGARKRGDVAEVARHATLANRHLGSTLADSSAVHQRYRDAVQDTYDASHFARVAPHGDPTTVPIFIVGLPRSGTTLVEQILASHPEVFGGGELRIVSASLEELALDMGDGAEVAPLRLPADSVSIRAARVAGHYEVVAGTHPRVTDKMPENYLHLGWIATLFPNARVIHVHRDPRDVALSLWLTRLVELDWACSLERIAEHIEAHDRLMQHWFSVLPLDIHAVSYEELVTDPDVEIRHLLEYCDLPWAEQCLRSHETERAVDTASTNQVAAPIHRSAMGGWREYRAVLEPILDRLEAIAVARTQQPLHGDRSAVVLGVEG